MYLAYFFTLITLFLTSDSLQPPYSGWYDYLECKVCQVPRLSGDIDDSCCDYETLDKSLDLHFYPLLKELTQTQFFSYFKVNLNTPCPFWNAQGKCSSQECVLATCSQEEIPSYWLYVDRIKQSQRIQVDEGTTAVSKEKCDSPSASCKHEIEHQLSKVNREINKENFHEFQGWNDKRAKNESYLAPEDDEEKMVYINLLKNPERFTGYGGESARKVWHAISQENCFKPKDRASLDGLCLEERVYYRLLSGLQTSISTHVAAEYKLWTGEWIVNTKFYIEHVARYPDRLQNLHFTYLFMMRAVAKMKEFLMNYDYRTGNTTEDEKTKYLVKRILSIDSSSCPIEGKAVLEGFDENMLFNGKEETEKEKQVIEEQFRSKFQNVTRIMDCVTCEKCRLWGKLQILGIGTAIKILLASDVNQVNLQRNEIIALIVSLAKFSESVENLRMFRQREFREAIQSILWNLFLASITIGLFYFTVKRCMPQKRTVRKSKRA